MSAQAWKVFDVNDSECWMALTVEDAVKAAYMLWHGTEPAADEMPELLDETAELNDAGLDERMLWLDEDTEKTSYHHWQCGCGAMADALCRWNGKAYEHHHGYQAGHVEMKNIHLITYREQLARLIAEGPKVQMFSCSDF